MAETTDARFGEPLFGEVEFSEQPDATLVQTVSRLAATAPSLTRTVPERRVTT